MIKIDNNICTAKCAKDYVAHCEAKFEKRLDDAVVSLLNLGKTRIITLSGPTCSGKTTTAAKLTDVIETLGFRARVLSIDDFYRDSIRNSEKPDYESAAAIDLDYFSECTEKLLCTRTVLLPTFDMKTGRRSALTEYHPSEKDIYIFEGIQAVYPEVTCHLKALGYKSIFINVEEDVCANGVIFSKDEVRLMRRLVRDEKFRNTGVEGTLFLWDAVRENEEKNIFPPAKFSDVKINSFLPYEVFFIGRYLIPLLENAKTEQYKMCISRLKSKVERITNYYITEDMIPYKSVFREFIG